MKILSFFILLSLMFGTAQAVDFESSELGGSIEDARSRRNQRLDLDDLSEVQKEIRALSSDSKKKSSQNQKRSSLRGQTSSKANQKEAMRIRNLRARKIIAQRKAKQAALKNQQKRSSSKLASKNLKTKTASVKTTSFKNVNSREELVNNLPQENDQVRALLAGIDHVKVFYSINHNGKVSDIFQDEHFMDVYQKKMKKETKQSMYHFFKGIQDHKPSLTGDIKPKLDRSTTLNRNDIDSFILESQIKSKLTRSLKGVWPKAVEPPSVLPDKTSVSVDAN